MRKGNPQRISFFVWFTCLQFIVINLSCLLCKQMNIKAIAMSVNRLITFLSNSIWKSCHWKRALRLRVLISFHKCYHRLPSKDANRYVFCRVFVLITSAYADNIWRQRSGRNIYWIRQTLHTMKRSVSRQIYIGIKTLVRLEFRNCIRKFTTLKFYHTTEAYSTAHSHDMVFSVV
jgi:hypothetical protein